MFLTYIQHGGCPTRMLVMAPDAYRSRCPDCESFYNDGEWSNSPLPTPFMEQINARCAIVIKPTNGFFQSYKIGDDLHVGISDSRSVVHAYWTNGIAAEESSWDRSILVYQFQNDESNWFDNSLSSYISQNTSRFLGEKYNDIDWNCFDFVMEFLRYINCRNYTKVHFVAEFVQVSLKKAIKYCTLVSKVQEKGSILIG